MGGPYIQTVTSPLELFYFPVADAGTSACAMLAPTARNTGITLRAFHAMYTHAAACLAGCCSGSSDRRMANYNAVVHTSAPSRPLASRKNTKKKNEEEEEESRNLSKFRRRQEPKAPSPPTLPLSTSSDQLAGVIRAGFSQ